MANINLNLHTMKKFTLFIAFLSLLLNSCQKESLDDMSYLPESNLSSKSKIVNGRFVFSSRDNLKTIVAEMKNEDTKDQYSKFENYYKKGFRSLQPIVDPANKNLISKLSEEIIEKQNKSKNSDSESEEPTNIVADPYLAAFINENNEIVVNDSLYKFTEKGLFFVATKDSTHLFTYLKNNKSSANKQVALDPCIMRAEYGGYTQIDAQITQYIAPIDGDCGYGGGGGGGSTPPPISQLSSEEKLQKIVQSLPICDGNAGGNWVQGFFGKSFVCRSHFDGDHRIKTEFWDQTFPFYTSVGIQVKTQVKTLGIWWASDAHEIHLGINRILLKYNFPQPQINAYTPTGGLITKPYKAPVYMYDGKFLVNSGVGPYGSTSYYSVQLKVTKNYLPFFRLNDNPILNIYIPNTPLLGDVNFNYNASDITSNSNITALYKMGIDFLEEFANEGDKKMFAVTYQESYDKIVTLYFGERFQNTNDNKIEKKFYEDVGFNILGSKNGDSDWEYSISPNTDYFRNYTSYEVDFYGVARRGSTWKGNRMINP